MTLRARQTWLTTAAVLAIAATPKLAWACWDMCTQARGYEFKANGTTYQLVSCTQTWPDGYNNPITVCKYRNLNW
jgi:hypothetical protein